MATAPKYRIWLKDDPDYEKFRKYCPDGIPCNDFFKGSDKDLNGIDFAFNIDFSALSLDQKRNLFPWMYPEGKSQETYRDDHFNWISSTEVIKVTDSFGSEFDVFTLELSWILVENACKFEKINMEIDGNAIHLLIMGLQQALFIEPDQQLSVNDLILPMRIEFIKKLSNGEPSIKEAYITGFPDEYVVQARELLFS